MCICKRKVTHKLNSNLWRASAFGIKIGAEGGNAAWDGDRLVGLVRLLDDSEYIEIMPEESKNAAFYQRFGF